nr:hypothetical protein [Tanacetum cinerariifolium]
ANARTCE